MTNNHEYSFKIFWQLCTIKLITKKQKWLLKTKDVKTFGQHVNISQLDLYLGEHNLGVVQRIMTMTHPIKVSTN